ncbi:TIR domain-containing protein [Sphingomonas sp. CCH5-D11]|uniref:TIR domain-containing protein n=1 Tax=Sphingomonas sp. CCH5-D11 TaxID=1768786 RepID=UPI00082E31F9|nr:TIR domain-containing protein [Sphingomonas sp. CCH5-D11]
MAAATPNQPKRIQVSQSDFPNTPIDQVLRLAQGLWDNFAGKGTAPLRVAMALGVKPTSGPWRNLCGSSIAYGLTDGGYNAAEITLTPLGLKIVRPTEDGEDMAGIREAILKPRIQRDFLERYNNAKFPKDVIAQNVLVDMGLPKERAEQALAILKANAESAGVLADIKGDKFVFLEGAGITSKKAASAADEPANDQAVEDDAADWSTGNFLEHGASQSAAFNSVPPNLPKDEVRRVFITHGKNTKILGQIEKIVRHGGFEPVIAKNNETAAKPVPDKVLDDMRSCQAAVIHVGTDSILYDKEGKEVPVINQNVLIEIGVARAWYTRKFILLVEDGVLLPSNLQGLYECRYSGDGLDMEATFKLLEAFSDFRSAKSQG